MKKTVIVLTIAAAMLCLCMVGCSGESSSKVTSEASNTSSSSSAPSVDAAYVAANDNDFILVDVRTPGEYEAGHIPGAINIEYSSSPCEGKTVATDTADKFMAAGINPDDAIVLYCRTGVRAQAAASALESAGYTNIKVYTGSWQDWTSDPSRPVE